MTGSAEPIEVPCDATIDCSAKLKAELIEAARRNRQVALDASRVNEIDTRVFQMFVIADEELRGAGGSLTLTGASDSFLAAAEHLGLGARVAAWRGE